MSLLARKAAAGALAVCVLLAGWAAFKRRQALDAFRAGAQAYYMGDLAAADAALRRSLAASKDPRVASFLAGLLVDQAFARLQLRDVQGAAKALSEAALLWPEEGGLSRAAAQLSSGGALAGSAERLESLAAQEDAPAAPPGPAADPQLRGAVEALARAQAGLERAFYLAAALALLLLAAFIASLAWLAWALFGPRGAVRLLLEQQSRLQALPQEGRRFLAAGAVREIEAIEAEFTVDSDRRLAGDLLEPYLKDADAGVRARAALVLARHEPARGLALLKAAIESAKGSERLELLSALSRSPLPMALEGLASALEDPDRSLQAAAVRALVAFKAQAGLDEQSRARAAALLEKVRQDWIV